MKVFAREVEVGDVIIVDDVPLRVERIHRFDNLVSFDCIDPSSYVVITATTVVFDAFEDIVERLS